MVQLRTVISSTPQEKYGLPWADFDETDSCSAHYVEISCAESHPIWSINTENMGIINFIPENIIRMWNLAEPSEH
jgi:hypothetical protein